MFEARRRTISINNIKIPEPFRMSPPSPRKIIEKTVDYVLNGNIDRIYVDKNFTLFDGYCAYLILKHTGVEKVRVVVTREVKK